VYILTTYAIEIDETESPAPTKNTATMANIGTYRFSIPSDSAALPAPCKQKAVIVSAARPAIPKIIGDTAL
jgi:hypothetical protein